MQRCAAAYDWRVRGGSFGFPVDVAQAERPELFSKKLAVCSVVYEFRTEEDSEAKEEKRQTLLELIDFVNVKKSITEAMYKETIDMVRGPAAAHQRDPTARLIQREREARCASHCLGIARDGSR